MGKILVIGDVLLDKYDYVSTRVNPESSAPCYTVDRIEYKAGGAGNVAANLVSLGSDCELVSVIGDDAHASLLEATLRDSAIPSFFVKDKARLSIVKERSISSQDGRYINRKDYERKEYINTVHVNDLMTHISAQNYSLIIVSDYAKGTITEELMLALKGLNIPILADPKPKHKQLYTNIFLITPNVKEIMEMQKANTDLEATRLLQKELHTDILLTRSEKGMVFIGANTTFEFPAQARKVFDVTGAGDTVIATLAHFYNMGKDLKTAIELSNIAGGIAVGYPGCYQVKTEEIKKNYKGKI